MFELPPPSYEYWLVNDGISGKDGFHNIHNPKILHEV